MDTDEESPMDDLVKLTSRMRAAYSPWQEDRSYGLMQCYLATVAAMHAYNYLEILGGLDGQDEDLVEGVLEMLNTSVEALEGMCREVERMGCAPQGLALIIKKNILYIGRRLRDLADSCPEDDGSDDSQSYQGKSSPQNDQ
ncbi:MAG TPA: hypothetical protein VJH22_03190 [Candidatus Nanoarchaeia archaeon]|nr:hypothetical protein [Candidatus Nanoarchaeia archaeon]